MTGLRGQYMIDRHERDAANVVAMRDRALLAIGMSREAYFKHNKSNVYLRPRRAVVYAIRELTGASWSSIAEGSNRTHHSIIWMAHQTQVELGVVTVGGRTVTNREWLDLVVDGYVLETSYTGFQSPTRILPSGRCRIAGPDIEPGIALKHLRRGAGRSGPLVLSHSHKEAVIGCTERFGA